MIQMSEFMFCVLLIICWLAGLSMGFQVFRIWSKRKFEKWKKEHPVMTYDQIIDDARKIMMTDGWKTAEMKSEKEEIKEPVTKFHLKCKICGKPYWSDFAFPKIQLCDKCFS